MKTHILLDIEALGTRPGSAIIELGAVEFFPDSGTLGRSFEVLIDPQSPFTTDEDTLLWHSRKGTWPRPANENTLPICSALARFEDWLSLHSEIEAFWSWGATYDFPLLTAAYDFMVIEQPWPYWKQRCARTVWQLAFGELRHDPRPHRAVEDAKAAAVDLMAAMKALRGDCQSDSPCCDSSNISKNMIEELKQGLLSDPENPFLQGHIEAIESDLTK